MCLFVPVVGLLSFNPFEPTLSLFFHHLHKIPLLRIVISFTLLSRLGKSLHSMWSYVCVMLRNKCGVNWCKLCVPKPIKKIKIKKILWSGNKRKKKNIWKSDQNKIKERDGTLQKKVFWIWSLCVFEGLKL